MGAHHDAVDLSLAQKARIWSAANPGRTTTSQRKSRVPGAFGQGFKMMHFGARGGGVVVIADARGLRRGHHQRVIGMKQDEIRAKLLGLRQRKGKGLFIGGDFGGKEDGGGLAPSRLQDGCHGKPPGGAEN